MALHNDLNAEVKNDLVNFASAINGQAYICLGDTAVGDSYVRIYYYDSASTATADGEAVLSATGMGGTGRFLQQYSNYNTLVNLPIIPAAIPSGAMLMWGTASAPSGWLLCDGTAVSRTGGNATLFGVIGTTFGAGDGSTTFNLPDYRQKFPLGKAASGTGSTLAGTGGSIDHVHSVDPASTSTSSDGSHNHGGATGTPSSTVAATNLTGSAASTNHTHSISTDGAHTHTVDIAAFNSGTANPPFLAINYIIKL